MSGPELPGGLSPMRWIGLTSLAVRRTVERATGAESRRVWFSVGGVAVAVGLMLVVTGVGLGLSAESTVQSESVDYWIIPESNSGSTAVVSTGGTQFGGVHAQSARIERMQRVDYATPMLMQLIRTRTSTSGEPEFILALGIIPKADHPSVAGISTAGLSPGDPYYANGSYDGRWTGDVVLSPAAAEVLNASNGDPLQVSSTNPQVRPFRVTNVSSVDVGTGMGQIPIAVFRLSELQTITGAAAGDQADQLLVSTNALGIKNQLATIYPRSTVVTRSGFSTTQSSDLSLAVSVMAFIVALIVGTLFVATTMGLEIVADRQQLAVLAAIGFRGRDRALLVFVQTLCITIVGGLFGILLGIGGIELTNHFTRDLIGAGVARFHPVLIGYGLGVAVLIAFLSAPYLVVLTRRTKTLEALSS